MTRDVKGEGKRGRSAPTGAAPISVVVPAFDAAGTLAEAVESVLAQSRPDWEMVIVDDGSTDETPAIAADFAARDRRIRLVRQPNGGEAAARNTGVAAAAHDWLLFLDADDWIAPEHLERMASALASDPTLDAVYCRWARVAADGTVLVDGYEPPAGDLFEVWARRSAFPVHACVVRRSLVDAVGRFDTTLRKSADWDLWQRIARTGARFGAVREVLAFYRMSPRAASLDATQMLADGLRVLRQGHAPDPRVARPSPEHASGLPPERIPTQAFYLLSWCAGILLGRGEDPRLLLRQVEGMTFPELYPDAVAQCLFDAAPLPRCEPPAAWERLWPVVARCTDAFLEALEAHAAAPGLASRARLALVRRALAAAPSWKAVSEEAEELARRTDELARQQGCFESRLEEAADRIRTLEASHAEQQASLAARLEQAAAEIAALREGLEVQRADAAERIRRQDAIVADLEESRREAERFARAREEEAREARRTVVALTESNASSARALEAEQREVASLRAALAQVARERDLALGSPEQRFGHLVLNRLRLKGTLERGYGAVAVAGQRLTLARLAAARRTVSRNRTRVLATACTEFPIYSQTFVHQELSQLVGNGFDVRVAYSVAGPRSALGGRFDDLWPTRRRLFQHRPMHHRHLDRYRQRMPARVDAILDRIAEASGLTRADVEAHDNVLEAFTFARMAEAYRADYLHSYFFYDRSLMALIAAWLLGIPRGISCYADHVLDDYELKVVPLHLELADVVVATSEGIRRELLGIAPGADPGRILVKPNGIDVFRFPVLPRAEPAEGQPFRIVTVSRIEPKKGLLELVDAVHRLRAEGLAVEAHLVGATDEWSLESRRYKASLDERITERGLWGAVHLEGLHDVSGVLRFLGLAQLFVAPFVETAAGDKDGIPTALLEGMATGLAAVATNAGSIPEVVRHGVDGLVVPQRDPQALADAIRELLADPARRAAMGARAAEAVRDRFDAARCEAAFHDRVRRLARREHGTLHPPATGLDRRASGGSR